VTKEPGWLPFLNDLANRADEISLRWFGAPSLPVREKPDRTPVTAADEEIEEAIRSLVQARHPELGVYGEERGISPGAGVARLILDPIDGTANFARRIPIFATLMAIEVGEEIVAGLVSAPALGSRWTAARGGGAYHGERRMRVSGVERLEEATLFHGSLAESRAGREGEENAAPLNLLALARRCARSRGFGDFLQHVLVAQGSGEIAIDPSVKPYDLAPLLVIVEEAGGRATSLEGERSIYRGTMVCTNGRLHDETLAALRGLTGGAASLKE